MAGEGLRKKEVSVEIFNTWNVTFVFEHFCIVTTQIEQDWEKVDFVQAEAINKIRYYTGLSSDYLLAADDIVVELMSTGRKGF